MTQESSDWRTGWTADSPVYVGYAWAPNEGGEYLPRAGDGLLRRDLGVARASSGAIGIERLRAGDAGEAQGWRLLDCDFELLYVLRGSVQVESGDGDAVALREGGCAVHPGGYLHRLSGISADFDAVHITSPAGVEALRADAALAASRREHAHGPVYTHDTDDQYMRGDGPRAFFSYRDLGTRGPTQERIHVHVVRASEPGAGTGWHYHTMSQWFMVIGGSSTIAVGERPRQPLAWGDAMCIGSGETMRHDVSDFSGDYLVLEMCIPASYETIAVDPPATHAR